METARIEWYDSVTGEWVIYANDMTRDAATDQAKAMRAVDETRVRVVTIIEEEIV